MNIRRGDWLHKPEWQTGEGKKANLQLFGIYECVAQTAASWKEMSFKKSIEEKIHMC